METVVDVNGDYVGLLWSDGRLETKEEAFERVFDRLQSSDGYDDFEITYDCSEDEGVTIDDNDLVTHDYSESVTVCDVIEETTSDTTYYLDDDFNIFMTDNFGNMISLNKIRKDKNGKYCRC